MTTPSSPIVAPNSDPFHMIKTAKIENFRCFRSARIDDCRAVNIILGKNAAGKTALLEALFLALGRGPEVALRFRVWRGFEQNTVNTAPGDLDRPLWRDLFNDFDMSKTIKVSLTGTDIHARSVEIKYDERQTFATTSTNPVPMFPSPISFKYTRPAVDKKQRRAEWTVKAQFIGNGFQFSGMEAVPVECSFYSATMNFTNAENVERYSKLSLRRDNDNLIKFISNEFSFIDGLEILTIHNVPTLHVTSPWYENKRPLGDISMGVSKYVSIILAILSMKDGVIIIDEIENGFYYDRFESIWSSIIGLAKERNVQIFATTHSLECLEALQRASTDMSDEITFIRAEIADGAVSLNQFHGSTTFDAMSAGRDPR